MTSCVFGLPMFISNGIHRSKGDTMRAMWISLLMNLINIITSVMLAFGWGVPKLGYYGVAWGTVISRTAGSILSVGWLWSPASIQLRLAHFCDISKTMLSRLWYLTAPALAERIITESPMGVSRL
jgi:Na+-driven multidrug efflux pump